MSHDRLLYVCDRVNDRIQVFNPDGTFVEEMFIERETLGAGSVWDIAFSHDGEQKYLYVADGVNEKVYIIERKTMTMVSSFRERRPPAGAVLRHAQRGGRLARQHLHHRDLRG